MYNELQWKKGRVQELVEKARNIFLESGKAFLRQYRVPEMEMSQLIITLAGHSAGVLSCAFSPDGKKIVSASIDKTLKLWNSSNGEEICTLNGHSSWVTSCAFSPDGKKLFLVVEMKP